ncbi:hypothetical protein AGMMS49938_14400 [Fibrobacterales bacterium]|nr:hypothetical protein AGMMS49938_14400 [Fibrobacterales bacterium]
MSKNQSIATWAAFVLSKFRKKYKLSESDFAKAINEYKAVSFLIGNYELLHYYDFDFAVDDLGKYIAEQGWSLNAAA